MGGDKLRSGSAGSALIVVLVILFVTTSSSITFIHFMNRQLGRGGQGHRSAAALAAAEGGLHRALSMLEAAARDGSSPDRAGLPAPASGALSGGSIAGDFAVSFDAESDGAVIVTSIGRVAGVTRRLRARVYLATPALLAGVYGAGFVRLEQSPATTVIVPYGAGLGDRPWIHIAAGEELWFGTADVAVNDPGVPFRVEPGPVDPPDGAERSGPAVRPDPVRLLLARNAELTLNRNRDRVDLQQLRTMGVAIDGVVLRVMTLPPPPEVDGDYYRLQAVDNTSNAGLNEAAGAYLGDAHLARKRDSLYSAGQFERLQSFLASGRGRSVFRGIVYVTGGVALIGGQELYIEDGALIAENAVFLSGGARLRITHSAATRTLPGLVLVNNGGLIVTRDARLSVHGLVLAGRTISIGEGAYVDVVGAIVGADPGLSLRNAAGTVVVRYDPAVLGTRGLRAPRGTPVVAWVAGVQELR